MKLVLLSCKNKNIISLVRDKLDEFCTKKMEKFITFIISI